MSLPEHLRPTVRPIAHPDNVIRGEHYRITVLHAGIVRFEYAEDGGVEDRASQAVWFRDADPVPFEVDVTDTRLELDTARLHLSYDLGRPSSEGLSVQVKGGITTWHSTWRHGVAVDDLGGTARTLDGVDGPVPLEPGILSRGGVTCYDDSATLLLTDDWFAPREPGRTDLYVFAFGRDYDTALREFFAITGPPPVLPRWALGNWWSRYHPYTSEEYLALHDRFAAERLPFSVAVLDMDWHPVDIDPELGSGWTGYSWNRDLVPDPPAFLAALHGRGLRVTLNVHPADGVRAHEDAYPDVAAAMGLDPATRTPVAFDAADPRFWRTYFDDLHHPREAEGVDFWWIDWQQGPYSRMRGLDPLWVLNHLHFLDAAARGGSGGSGVERPMTFSRYAGVGSHRYPIGFSGDTVISWASLAFQAEFTASAANVGYGWWSHDVGGHMWGSADDELATRWVQLGVFSPILRLHSTLDAFASKEPWRFGESARRIMGESLRLRHRLVPYLHTMNRRAHEQGLSLVRPMYHDHPEAEAAYEVPGQFAFGDRLVVAPITAPTTPASRTGVTMAWIPPGRHVDLVTGLRYDGGDSGRRARLHRGLDDTPVLAPAGAVLPLAGHGDVAVGVDAPAELDLLVVAGEGAEGAFDLAEDGPDGGWITTPIRWEPRTGELVVGPARRDGVCRGVDGEAPERVLGVDGRTAPAPRAGDAQALGGRDGQVAAPPTGLPDERTWRLVLVGFAADATVTLADGTVLPARPAGAGSPRGALAVELPAASPARELRVVVRGEPAPVADDLFARCLEVLHGAQMAYPAKNAARDVLADARARADAPLAGALLGLDALGLPADVLGVLTEILLAS